jgi:hypothetical protein
MVEAKLDIIVAEISRIKFLIDNDSGTGRLGIYQELQETKREVRELKKELHEVREKQRTLAYKIGLLGTAAGFIGGIILASVKAALTKFFALIF